jgi:hypothetical protein
MDSTDAAIHHVTVTTGGATSSLAAADGNTTYEHEFNTSPLDKLQRSKGNIVTIRCFKSAISV